MSNPPGAGIPTQITVQNYDQLPGVGELLPLDQQVPQVAVGGRYDFDDGGLYVGGWFEGKANGYGICTGPNCQGEYSGSWSFGFEVSGIYKWPQGTTYQGQWQNGRRHGLGIEYRGNWSYKGEWTQGNKGRYGVRCSNLSQARYEGTFANGLQDGYGSETYADGGNFQGQWFRGMRHGFGVRQSASYGSVLGMTTLKPSFLSGLSSMDKGSTQSLDADGRAVNSMYRRDMNMVVRGGFVLVGRPSGLDKNGKVSRRRNSVIEKSNAAARPGIFRGLLKKQKSTGDIDMHGATISRVSHQPPSGIHSVSSSTDSISLSGHMRFGGSNALLSKQFGQDFDGQSNASFIIDSEQIDPTVTETYMGEWKDDKRSGFGICERSDGLFYAGEWYQNKKNGYGVTTFPDGTTEEGKYKNNLLIVSSKKRIAFVLRPTKLKERIDSAVNAAKTAQQTAMKKADIAISRTATARDKAEQAVLAANQAQNDSKLAVLAAKQFGALVIDPTTNTISPTDQASTLSNLNDTESIINRIKNQNLISLNDGQLSVPEIPLRRRLSQHNEARKSFRSQSIKDVQNLEFNNLHKINQPAPEKPDAFPGRQASLRGRQQPNDPNSNPYQTNLGVNSPDYLTSQAGPAQQPPFHSASSNPPSTYGYQTESPHSFASTQSRNNLIRQSSLGQTNSQFQQQQHPSSSMYQSQPHLVRPNSSASSSINHPYTSQRPPLNVQTSFDLGKSMIDHMDHYQSLHNRYASTSKINQKTAGRNRTFASSGNLPGQQPQSMTNLQNRNLLGSNQPAQQQHGLMGNLNRNTSNLSNLPTHFQHTPDSGVGSLEESSSAAAAHYQQQQQAHQLSQQQLQNPHLLSPSQQALLQPHQLPQHMLQSQFEQQRQGMLNPSGSPQQQQFMGPAGMHPLAQLSMPQSQFNPLAQQTASMASMQPYGGSQFNLSSPLTMQQPGLQQAALNSLQSMQQQQPQFNPLGQFNPMGSQPGQLQMQPQQMWNLNQQQSPFQSMAGQMNQFPASASFQHSPPIPNQQFQQPSPPLNDPSLAFLQQQQQQPNRQVVQQQIQQQQQQLTQPAELMNRANAQSIQSKERQLEQHYGKQAAESGAEPKRSSWRTASLFNNRPDQL